MTSDLQKATPSAPDHEVRPVGQGARPAAALPPSADLVPVRPPGFDAPGPLGRLARLCVRRRRRVVLAWLTALGLGLGLSLVAGGTYSADYSAPGSDSTAAHSVLREAFASSGGRPKINVV
ncbi:MAG: hypothetical protein JWP11_1443, partial [Frankiales bacterium]|nr:hypothetical protein [Frankiales bacterium]